MFHKHEIEKLLSRGAPPKTSFRLFGPDNGVWVISAYTQDQITTAKHVATVMHGICEDYELHTIELEEDTHGN